MHLNYFFLHLNLHEIDKLMVKTYLHIALHVNVKAINLFVHRLLECFQIKKKGKRKFQGVPQSQTAALSRHREEEETDKTKEAKIE